MTAPITRASAQHPLSVFNFDQHPVRIVVIDGEPWFVGKDVALTLGYADPTNAMKRHCRGVAFRHPIADSLGRKQEARILGEPDVLRLIVNSNLPAAERFEKWVFEEVLPSIRKTGGYQPIAVPPAPTLKAVEDSYALAAALLPEIAKAIQAGLTGATYRWFLSFDHQRKPSITSIPDDAYMLSYSDMLKTMMSADGAPLKTEELEVFINAATRKLASRAAFHQQRAKDMQEVTA
ncbi:MAG: Bro-N domain-containing protein [Brachymonas denitrificans]